MKSYYNRQLFRPGWDVERNLFLVDVRNQLRAAQFPSVIADAECKGKAYAWELLSRIARATPGAGADWSNWAWREPATPQPSILSEAFSAHISFAGKAPARDAPDFDTFEMIHLSPIASKHAKEEMLDKKKRAKSYALGQRSFKEFPASSTELKTIWRRIPKDSCIALGVWDGMQGSIADDYYGDEKWKRHVLVYDSTQGDAKSACSQAQSPTRDTDIRLKAQDYFVWMRVSPTTSRFRLKGFPTKATVSLNDLLILVGMHIAKKDVPDWAWITTWWKSDLVKPEPQETQGRDNVFQPSSLWNNYVLNYSLSFQHPCSPKCENGGRNFVYNPYLEAGKIPNGTRSNCVACHAKARYVQNDTGDLAPTTVPLAFGTDLMLSLFEGATMTDYSWTASRRKE